MASTERQIPHYEPEIPSEEDKITAVLLKRGADVIQFDSEQNNIVRLFEGGTMAASKQGQSWTFNLTYQDQDPAKIRLSQYSPHDLEGNISTTPYILIGERGINSEGKTDFVSWRNYNAVRDENEIGTLFSTLEIGYGF